MFKKNSFSFFIYIWIIIAIIVFVFLYKFTDWQNILNFFIAINISTFILFGLDKYQSIKKAIRVPEKLFFITVFLGGSIGALFGIYFYRHKTQKFSFQIIVFLLILMQIALLAIIFKKI